jgi:hypothetical protein
MALLICLIFLRALILIKYETTPRAYIFKGTSCIIAAGSKFRRCAPMRMAHGHGLVYLFSNFTSTCTLLTTCFLRTN